MQSLAEKPDTRLDFNILIQVSPEIPKLDVPEAPRSTPSREASWKAFAARREYCVSEQPELTEIPGRRLEHDTLA